MCTFILCLECRNIQAKCRNQGRPKASVREEILRKEEERRSEKRKVWLRVVSGWGPEDHKAEWLRSKVGRGR